VADRPGPWPHHGYRLALYLEQDAVAAQDVVDLWTRNRVLPPDEAARRVREVLLVATDADGTTVGVCTAYLQHSVRLHMDLWHFRTFVDPAHRSVDLARVMARISREQLQERYVSGADTRGAGVLYEVEAEVLKQNARAVWTATQTVFLGENERGAHLRVFYFPGAPAPEPPAAQSTPY
jgi:hypothetical protein